MQKPKGGKLSTGCSLAVKRQLHPLGGGEGGITMRRHRRRLLAAATHLITSPEPQSVSSFFTQNHLFRMHATFRVSMPCMRVSLSPIVLACRLFVPDQRGASSDLESANIALGTSVGV
jgi:hypothetical protein